MRFVKLVLVSCAVVLLAGAIFHERAAANGNAGQPQLKADGGAPLPRPPQYLDGGAPLPRPPQFLDGGAPLPRPPQIAEGVALRPLPLAKGLRPAIAA